MVVLSAISSFASGSGVQVSIAYVIVVGLWFGFISVLAYAAEERRARSLGVTLLGVEGIVALVEIFNLMRFAHIIEAITSAFDLGMALVVIYLTYPIALTGKARRSKAKQPLNQARNAANKLHSSLKNSRKER